MATPTFLSGTGRRKTAVARVRLLPGEGEIVINGRSLVEHFGAAVDGNNPRLPFKGTNTAGPSNAIITGEGGGVAGRAPAARRRLPPAPPPPRPQGHAR